MVQSFSNLWLLLLAHFIGDFPLQSQFIAMNKNKYWYIMCAHCYIWAGVVSLVLMHLGIFAPWKFVFLFIGHYIVDYIKSSQKTIPENWWMIYPDQIFHVAQLLIVLR